MKRTSDRQPEDRSGAPAVDPRPAHPWPASIALVIGVVVLLFALAWMSTFR